MRRLVLLSVWVGSIMAAQACGGSTDTDDGGLDASTDDVTAQDNFVPPQDTGTDDVVTTDTGTDAGTGDATDASTTPDSGNKIQTWTCGNATVTDCAQCIGHTQNCVYCANNDASVLSGVCVQLGTGCGNTAPQGFNLCSCPKDASTCPQSNMVCLQATQQTSVCDPCGAVQTTDGLTCQNGGKCDAVDGGCL